MSRPQKWHFLYFKTWDSSETFDLNHFFKYLFRHGLVLNSEVDFHSKNILLSRPVMARIEQTKVTLFAALAGVLTLWIVGCASTSSSLKGRDVPVEIKDLAVDARPDQTEVILAHHGPLNYFSFPLKDPDRLIVDLAGTTFGHRKSLIEPDQGVLHRILLSEGEAPDYIARMELTFSEAAETRIQEEGNQLIIQMKRRAEAPPTAPAPTEVSKNFVNPEIEKKPREAPMATEVSRISIQPDAKGIEIVITGNGKMKPRLFRLKGERLVMDIPGVINKALPNSLPVGHPVVSEIRVGQHYDPTKVRLVFYVVEPVDYQIQPGPAGVHLTIRPGK
jgi:AMIN domain